MKHIRAVTVDLNNTPWDNRPGLMAAEQALYAWLGRHYPRVKARSALDGTRSLRQDLLRQDPELREWEAHPPPRWLDCRARNGGTLPHGQEDPNRGRAPR
jgi:hypothetical protein